MYLNLLTGHMANATRPIRIKQYGSSRFGWYLDSHLFIGHCSSISADRQGANSSVLAGDRQRTPALPLSLADPASTVDHLMTRSAMFIDHLRRSAKLRHEQALAFWCPPP